MNCPECNVRMHKARTTQVFDGNIIVENISALCCPKCGEKFFGEKAYAGTLQKVQEVKREIPVPLLAKIKVLFL